MTRTTLRTPAALVTALAVSAAVLTGCSGDEDTEPTGGEPTSATDSPSDGESPGDGAVTSGPTAGAGDVPPDPEGDPQQTIPVYFTGDTPTGTRLYREFFRVDNASDPLLAGVDLLLQGASPDPDYGTLLDGVSVQAVERTDEAIVVTLAEDSVTTAGKSTTPEDAEVAVQSLVYTLQGAIQERLPVRVQLPDESPVDLLGQPTGEGLRAAPQLDVLALVNVSVPRQGDVVAADVPMLVEGVASSFEATVPLSVLDADGEEVLSESAMAEGWIDRLYPYLTELDISDLPPGEYTLVARTDDPTGGTEGPGPYEDTKDFTIQ